MITDNHMVSPIVHDGCIPRSIYLTQKLRVTCLVLPPSLSFKMVLKVTVHNLHRYLMVKMECTYIYLIFFCLLHKAVLFIFLINTYIILL
jgi:hypothetical protein